MGQRRQCTGRTISSRVRSWTSSGRLAPPALYAWQDDDQPLRLIEQTVARDDPDPQALACYGLLAWWWDTAPHRSEDLWLRFERAAVIAPHGTIAAYSSDADPEPRVPFWPLLFNNVTIRLVGSDDLSAAEERQAVADIAACLEAGALRPHIAQRFPLGEIVAAHEALEGSRAPGHIILDIA